MLEVDQAHEFVWLFGLFGLAHVCNAQSVSEHITHNTQIMIHVYVCVNVCVRQST